MASRPSASRDAYAFTSRIRRVRILSHSPALFWRLSIARRVSSGVRCGHECLCLSVSIIVTSSQHRIPALPVQLRGAACLFEKLLSVPVGGEELVDELPARLCVLAVCLDVTREKA